MPKIPRMLAVGTVAIACSSSEGEGLADAAGSPASTNGAVGEPPPPMRAAIVATTPTPPAQRVDATPRPAPSSLTVDNDKVPLGLTWGWETDFSKHSVSYSAIRSGASPGTEFRLDVPVFEPLSGDVEALRDNEPVISVEINGEAKAYPLAILIRHEIVNDEAGGVPVTVTFCPLCNTAIVFDRMVNGQILDFGTTGKLRNSDLVMWDRQTES